MLRGFYMLRLLFNMEWREGSDVRLFIYLPWPFGMILALISEYQREDK